MKAICFLTLLLVSRFGFSGISPNQFVEGVITKIEADRVTVSARGKDIVIDKQYIPRDQLRPGAMISVVAPTPKKP